MAKAKCIPLFDGQLETVAFMSDADLGAAVRAAMVYMRKGEETELTGCAGMLFAMLKAQYNRDSADMENGRKGGRPQKQGNGVSESKRGVSEKITPLSENKSPLLEIGTPVSKSKTNIPDQTGIDQIPPDQKKETGMEDEGADEPPPARSAPPIISLPLNDGTDYGITEDQVTEWKKLYPSVDVEQELRNMCGWLGGNPTRKKTRSGILRFVTGWLAKEQNKGGRNGGGQAEPEYYMPPGVKCV